MKNEKLLRNFITYMEGQDLFAVIDNDCIMFYDDSEYQWYIENNKGSNVIKEDIKNLAKYDWQNFTVVCCCEMSFINYLETEEYKNY